MSERIDPERIAALIDGRLTGEQRQDALRQLAADDEAFETFADAAAVTRELEEQDQPGVTPLRSRPPSPWRGPWLIAAALATLAAVPVVWSLTRDRTAEFGDVIAMLPSGAPADPTLAVAPPWTGARAAAGSQPITPAARAARVGALLVDLELAIAQRDSMARPAARQIAALLDEIPGGAVVASAYHGIARGTGDPELLPGEVRAATLALAGDRDVALLAAWAEAGRLAGDSIADVLSSRTSRLVLDRALELPALTPPMRRLVTRLRAAASTAALDRAAIEADLTELLRLLGTAPAAAR